MKFPVALMLFLGAASSQSDYLRAMEGSHQGTQGASKGTRGNMVEGLQTLQDILDHQVEVEPREQMQQRNAKSSLKEFTLMISRLLFQITQM